jgi:hypothetical protein
MRREPSTAAGRFLSGGSRNEIPAIRKAVARPEIVAAAILAPKYSIRRYPPVQAGIDLDESFNREFEETIEDLAEIFSREKVLEMAAQTSEEFEEKVREVLS